MNNPQEYNSHLSRDGTSECVEDIYRENHAFLRDKIRCLQCERNDMDDVFQDFFLSLLCNPIPQEMTKHRGYLYRILQRDIIDRARKKKSHRNKKSQYVAYFKMQIKAGYKPEEITEEPLLSHKYTLIINIIQQHLPSRLSRALLLRYRYDYTHREIAEEMRISNSSARRYVCVGLRQLRKQLKQREVYELCRI